MLAHQLVIPIVLGVIYDASLFPDPLLYAPKWLLYL